MGRLLARDFSGPSIKCSGTTIALASSATLNAGAILDTVSYSAWVNPGASPGYSIFDVVSGNSFGIRYIGVRQYAVWYNGTQLAVSKLANPNTWTHVAGTYNRVTGVCAIYLNGKLSATVTNSLGQATPTDLRVANGVYSALTGYIAEPAIFNRVLTAAEIAWIYEQGPSAYPQDGSCVLDYRFKEGAVGGIAGEIIDASGKGNHGQLTMGGGRVDPYQIPFSNRVLIPAGMPLVSIESTGATSITVSDALLKTAFGETGANLGSTSGAVSGGVWVKKKKFATSYQICANKGTSGASGYGGQIDLHTALGSIAAVAYGNSISAQSPAFGNSSNLFKHAVWQNGGSFASFYHAGIKTKREDKTLTVAGSGNFALIGVTSGALNNICLPFIANRALTDDEVYRIYQSATFPPDVLFWHGANSDGTKVMCHKGTYGNRPAEVANCDATLGNGNYLSNDTPWN
jgi:hypothetical protein